MSTNRSNSRSGGKSSAGADPASSEPNPTSQASVASTPSPAPALASASGSGPTDAQPEPQPGRSAYPPFSAATAMILERIRGGNVGTNSISSAFAASAIEPSTYEDAKRRLVMNMNTTTNMLPSPRAPTAFTNILLADPNPSRMPPPARKVAQGDDAGTVPTQPAASSKSPSQPAPQVEPPPATDPPVKRGRGRPKGSTKAAKLAAKGLSGRFQKGNNGNVSTSAGASANASVAGTKRKRNGGEDDVGGPSGSDGDGTHHATPPTMMTKSGRQILKPVSYIPETASGSITRRRHYGKRTEAQALCKICTRGLSIPTNQIVFCDGCNSPWHQLCHDPTIAEEYVSDESRSWYCETCTAKKHRPAVKKKPSTDVVIKPVVEWKAATAEQKRSYFTNLPHRDLVNLMMLSLESHPDLPVFPPGQGPDTLPAAKRRVVAPGAPDAKSSGNAAHKRKSDSFSGPVNHVRSASHHALIPPQTAGKATTSHASSEPSTSAAFIRPQHQEQQQQRDSDAERERHVREGSEDSVDSVPPAWPKAGQGVLRGLQLKEDDFTDRNDFEAFSVAKYNVAGRKVSENGMPVAVSA